MILKKFKHYRIDLMATAVLSVIILVLTLMPMPEMPPAAGNDKQQHMLAFGALMVPIGLVRPAMLWAVAVYGVALGAVIEIVQPLTGRSAELADWGADILGIGIAGILVLIVNRFRIMAHPS